jgi:hypothetical protein
VGVREKSEGSQDENTVIDKGTQLNSERESNRDSSMKFIYLKVDTN